MKENKTVVKSGTSICTLLQVAFIVLKLCKVISWSWWLVLLPLEIEAALFIILIILYAVYVALGGEA